MEDEAFLFPVVVSRGHEVIKDACNKASATALAAWEPLRGVDGPVSVAMGCRDGSVYIFQPSSTSSSPTESVSQEGALSSKQTSAKAPLANFPNISRLQRPPSPAGSSASNSTHLRVVPSAKHASFQPSKSRAQAGLSKEQVEAPKSHVDYGDEPSKLHSLLKQRDTKERGLIETLMPSLNTGHHRQRAHNAETQPQRVERKYSYSQASTTQVSSTSTSPPISPTATTTAMLLPQTNIDTSTNYLNLAIHTFPPRFGQGRAVAAVEYVEDGALVAALQECSTLCLYSTVDGKCLSSIQISSLPSTSPPVAIAPTQGATSPVWKWRKLSSGVFGEMTFLCAVASESTSSWETPLPRTRVTIIHVQSLSERKFASSPEHLTKIGEWIVESPFQSVGVVTDSSGNPHFYHLTTSKHFVFSKLSILDRIRLKLPTASSEPPPDNVISLPMTTIPIPNPFKIRRPRAARPVSVYDVRSAGESLVELDQVADYDMPGFDDHEDFEVLVQGMNEGESVVAYSANTLKVFRFQAAKLNLVTSLEVQGIQSVELVSADVLVVRTDTDILCYRVSRDAGASLENILKISPSPEMVMTATKASLLSISLNSRGYRKLNAWRIGTAVPKRTRLWQNAPLDAPSVRITAALPLDLESVIVGFDDGYLRRTTFRELVTETGTTTPVGEPSDQALDGAIVSLHLCKNGRSGEHYIVGGTDGGVVAVWALQSLQLLARWTVFATPLMFVIKLVDDVVGRLRDSVLCVANGGTLAVLLLDGLEISFVIPGGPGRLEKICLGEDNLMLVYTNDMARLWDIKTQEFWRSMTRDKAEALLEQGGWFEAAAEPEGPAFSSSLMGCAEMSFASPDSATTFVLDIRQISSLSSQSKSIINAAPAGDEMTLQERVMASKKIDILRPLVASFLTFGLDESIDSSIQDAFGIYPAPTFCGICSFGGTSSLVNHRTPSAVWSVSGEYTSWRLLAICSILRASLGSQELDHDINTALIYYAASLSESVGKRYKPPSLDVLARYWFDSNTEIRTSARALFDAAVGQLSDEEVVALATDYQHRLPYLQPDIDKEAPWAVLALIIVGNLAIARHATFPSGTIMDVAASIALYLHDENSAQRIVGIDLSSRGLQIWQGYTDTMEIMRSLFDLATSPRKDLDGPPIRNARTQARLAILQIASTSTHLFMTKLLLDIVQPKTPEHSRSIMQLLAFLIRKKPLVLYPGLSRIMEAVVKAMDPNSSYRETVIDAATEILGEVVKLYPTVDFHSGSQKLVVGTNEGAAVLYDLKTATRLYVLEGHKKRLAACSFSPDGRRLVTLSLEESVVMVWKVGSSFTSFFYPGAPPRQGHSGSEPFKRLSFNVGSEAYMTTAATLEWIGFDWPADQFIVHTKDGNGYESVQNPGPHQCLIPSYVSFDACSMVTPLVTLDAFDFKIDPANT